MIGTPEEWEAVLKANWNKLSLLGALIGGCQMYLSDVYTVPVDIAGLPGISVPCGFTCGLPVGLQVVGRAFDEQTVLDVAHAFERATPFHRARPPIRAAATEGIAVPPR